MKKSLVLLVIAALAVVGAAGYLHASELIGTGKTLAFVPKQLGNPYFVAVKDAVEEAALANGFAFRVNAPDSSIEVDKQIAIVEAFIGAGVDVLVLIPNDATAVVDVINEAAKHGIAVFLVDSGADESDYISYIGTTTMPVDSWLPIGSVPT